MHINLIYIKNLWCEIPVVYVFTSFARSLFSSSSDSRSFLSSASFSADMDSIFSWLYTKKVVFPAKEDNQAPIQMIVNQVYRRSFAPVLPFLPTLGVSFGLRSSARRPSSWQRHQQHHMDGSSICIWLFTSRQRQVQDQVWLVSCIPGLYFPLRTVSSSLGEI